MNNKYSYIQIYLILFSFIFIISSIGQNNTNVLRDSIIVSDTNNKGSRVQGSQLTNQNKEIPWVDPLFFIDGQLCQHLRKIFQDSKGNLWFGTNNYGVMRYDGTTLEYFDKKNGYNFGRVTGIVEDEKGNVWFGTYKGLTKYDPSIDEASEKLFTNFNEMDGLLNNEIWSLIIDRNGIFWIGTNEGVSCFDGEKFTTFPIPKAHVTDTTTIYSYERITCILEDGNGALWFGTDGFGICKYDPCAELGGTDKTFTLITKEDGLPDNTIYELTEDSNENIWIGTYFGGISMFNGKTFTNFTKDGIINGVEVGGFFEDSNGDIWFAAENVGVYRYNGTSFTNYSTDKGLITNGILCIYKDNERRFWFGGWGGLFRYDPLALLKPGGKSFISVTKEGPWH